MTTLRRALLIDDEPLSRLELRRLLRAHPAIEVVGEVGTLSDARARLSVHDYDLVFLDIQLRGGNGFELLDSIAPTAQIVFVTAYDRFALRAFEVNALDYLLKPVGAARLAATLTRLEESRPAGGAAPALASTLPLAAEGEHALTMEDRVFVRSGASTRMLAVASICAIRSCENYTELFLSGGDVVMVLRTLKSWEQALQRGRGVVRARCAGAAARGESPAARGAAPAIQRGRVGAVDSVADGAHWRARSRAERMPERLMGLLRNSCTPAVKACSMSAGRTLAVRAIR
jgi:two-component system LytT family response regulator